MPSYRVSWGVPADIADNLTNDGAGTDPWKGWADHASLATNATVTTGGSDYGNYRDRFLNWLDWIIPQIIADPEINAALAYHEMYHYPFHNDGSAPNSDFDAYLSTATDGFATKLLAKFREHEPTKLLGFSIRQAKMLTRAKDSNWTPITDSANNLLFITGGYGVHGVLMIDPPLTGKVWPDDCTQPKYNTTDGEFEFITYGAAKNICFKSEEGPGLYVDLRTAPIGSDQVTFLNNLFDLYNQHANGWAFHALEYPGPQTEMAKTDALSGYFRKALLGSEPIDTERPRRDKLNATRAPGVSDDLNLGYDVGSRWITGSSEYVCLDATKGTAVWKETTGDELLVEDEKTADFTFDLTQGGSRFVSANHATVSITATVPPNSTTAFPVGHVIIIEQRGAAAVTLAVGSGVTINKPSSKTLVLAEQHAQAMLRKTATDTWVVGGELAGA